MEDNNDVFITLGELPHELASTVTHEPLALVLDMGDYRTES